MAFNLLALLLTVAMISDGSAVELLPINTLFFSAVGAYPTLIYHAATFAFYFFFVPMFKLGTKTHLVLVALALFFTVYDFGHDLGMYTSLHQNWWG